MSLYTLPKALYGLYGIKEILSLENNAILYKKLNQDLVNNEKLITAHSMVYIINGTVHINTYEGEEFVVSNGEMLFMPRDSYVISDFLKHGQNMEVYLLFFDHDIMLKFLETVETSIEKQSSICRLEVNQNIQQYFKNIEAMKFTTPHNRQLLESKLLEFLHLLTQKDTIKLTLDTSERGKQKREIDELMLKHYDKDISIAEFAALSGRSLSTFNREFKQKHAISPKKWIIKRKIEQAHSLLTEGMSVTDVAFEIGYKNVSNFIKAYKERYGQTPKAMQKNNP